MKTDLIMSIDVGTSQTKVVVFAPDLSVQGEGRYWHGYVSATEAGLSRVEQQPDRFLEAIGRAATMIEPSVRKGVVAIVVAGQMHGLICTDGRNRPLLPALLWLDRRAEPVVQELATQLPSSWSRGLGRLPDPGFPLAKWGWILREQMDVASKTRRVLGVKDWVRISLGGSPLTDWSEASGTDLFDGEAGEWNADILRATQLTTRLPRIVDGTTEDGCLNGKGAHLLGVPTGVSLVVGAGDFPAAAHLAAMLCPSAPLINVGTAGQVAKCAGKIRSAASGVAQFWMPVSKGRVDVVALLAVGLAFQWWRSISQENPLDETMSWRPDLPIFVPHLAGERRVGSRCSYGAFLGVRASHSAADLSQAVLLGVVFSLVEAMETLGEGARTPILAGREILQRALGPCLATTLGRPVAPLLVREPTAGGAASLVLGEKRLRDIPNLLGTPWEPDGNSIEHAAALYAKYRRARVLLQSI